MGSFGPDTNMHQQTRPRRICTFRVGAIGAHVRCRRVPQLRHFYASDHADHGFLVGPWRRSLWRIVVRLWGRDNFAFAAITGHKDHPHGG